MKNVTIIKLDIHMILLVSELKVAQNKNYTISACAEYYYNAYRQKYFSFSRQFVEMSHRIATLPDPPRT